MWGLMVVTMRRVTHMVTSHAHIGDDTIHTCRGPVDRVDAAGDTVVIAGDGVELATITDTGPLVPAVDQLQGGELVAIEAIGRYLIGTSAIDEDGNASGVAPWPPDPDGYTVETAGEWPELDGATDGQTVPIQFVIDALHARTRDS